MKRYSFILLALLCATHSFSQSNSFKITGTVITESDGNSLEAATVHLERVKDSTLITYTITDRKGYFSLEGKSYEKNLKLFISFVGYQTYIKTINLETDQIDLNIIKLNTISNLLNEVVVKSRSPIIIKKDTVEFNVASFKTKKDASIEDLLKELPGVEVDENGKITVNGKEVSKVLVNGKPFFGNDPTIATRNLTKDIIEKIQITDTKTKSQAFTGEQSTGDDKTLNLTIKKENNKGLFGRFSAGTGTDDRYEFAGMLNYFNNDRRISGLVGGNNINSPGFSFGEIEKMFGRGSTSFRMGSGGQVSYTIDGRSFGGGEGVTRSTNTGFNYADNLGKKVEVSADYFYSNSDSENENIKERENIIPDNRFFSTSQSNSTNESENHSTNFEVDIKIDSTLLINIQPSLQYSTNKRIYNTDDSSSDENKVLINESVTSSFIESSGKNFENNLSITKKFGNKGSFIRFMLKNEINAINTNDFLTSETEVFGTNPEIISRNQFSDENDDNNNLETNLTYRIPLSGKQFYLDLHHEYENEKKESIKNTFDFNRIDQDYTDFNSDQSTNFEYLNNKSEQGLRLSYKKDKVSLNLSATHIYRAIENKDILRPMLDLKRSFNTLGAYSRFTYRFSPRKYFGIRYNLRNEVPNINQLQPFTDISNPLNIVIGNPNLVPSNNHSASFNFSNYNFQKGTGFYSFMWSNFTNNQVVARTTIDENLLRTTTYANVNGNYNINVGSNYSKSIKIDSTKTLRFGIGLNIGKNRIINFSNGIKYNSINSNLSPSLSLSFSWKNFMELRPHYRIMYNKIKYNIDDFNNTDYLSHNLRIDFRTTIPKNLEWNNNIIFNYNPNLVDGFQKSAWFWNSSLSYSILKNKGIISIKAYDLLNQNTNAKRISTENYIEDSQSTVLQQFFMVGFSYKFNTLGKAGEIRKNRFKRIF